MKTKTFLASWRSAGSVLPGVLTSLWLAAAPVMAQSQQDAAAPKLQESKAVMEWVIGSVFVLGCLVVAFKNSKRSHVQ
jgi:hypothetical protein